MKRSVFLVMLFVGGCGSSFANVKATAKLGGALGNEPIVVQDWLAECEALHAPKDDPALQKICLSKGREYQSMVQTVHDVSDLLRSYADSLAQASDDDDVTVSDDLTAVMNQLGTLDVASVKRSIPAVYNLAEVVNHDPALVDKLTPSGIVTIVDTLVKFASQSYRRKQLQDVVVAADPHVVVLTAFLSAEVELHLKDTQNLRQLLDDEVSARPLVETTPVVAEILPLTAAALDDRIASLQRLDAACKSFSDAHHKLAVQMRDGKPWENGELLGELKKDVETIVKTVHGAQ